MNKLMTDGRRRLGRSQTVNKSNRRARKGNRKQGKRGASGGPKEVELREDGGARGKYEV